MKTGQLSRWFSPDLWNLWCLLSSLHEKFLWLAAWVVEGVGWRLGGGWRGRNPVGILMQSALLFENECLRLCCVMSVHACVCVGVCVCVRERGSEGEKERGKFSFQNGSLKQLIPLLFVRLFIFWDELIKRPPSYKSIIRSCPGNWESRLEMFRFQQRSIII